MLEKMKKNWLMKVLIILLLVFIVFEIYSKTESSKNKIDTESDLTVTPTTNLSTESNDKKTTESSFNDYGDEVKSDTENEVVQYDISEYVPYETDEFKVLTLNENKLAVVAKVDKNKAMESLNDFLKKEVTQESQTFEIVWQ